MKVEPDARIRIARRALLITPSVLAGAATLGAGSVILAITRIAGPDPRAFLIISVSSCVVIAAYTAASAHRMLAGLFLDQTIHSAPKLPVRTRLLWMTALFALGLCTLTIGFRLVYLMRTGHLEQMGWYSAVLLVLTVAARVILRKIAREKTAVLESRSDPKNGMKRIRLHIAVLYGTAPMFSLFILLAVYFALYQHATALALASFAAAIGVAVSLIWMGQRTLQRVTVAIYSAHSEVGHGQESHTGDA